MVDTKSKIYLSWDDIERLTNLLSVKIKMKHFQIDSIMGLPRGGLVPAVILSHKLNLPLVQKISQNTLIVDDICDSGNTFVKIYKKQPHLRFACLHFKPHTSIFNPTVYSQEVGDDWIVYPWEEKNAEPIADYLKISSHE
jgi:hypoxanthine phosphoribosyltransferase